MRLQIARRAARGVAAAVLLTSCAFVVAVGATGAPQDGSSSPAAIETESPNPPAQNPAAKTESPPLDPRVAPNDASHWRQFRGDGTGRSSARGLPLRWSETEGIRWKTPLPGRGHSSPVIEDGTVWTTTAFDEERSLRLLGVDADGGELVHTIEVFTPEAWQPGHPHNSYASPTPVAEPGRVCVHFGTYGTACLDPEGKVLWRRQLPQEHEVGPGSSPILWRDLLIVHCDGVDSQFVVAFDKDSGEERWRRTRHFMDERKGPHKKAFNTPYIFRWGPRHLVLSTGATHTSAYDAATGEEVWFVRHEGYSNVAMPMVGLGLAFVNSGFVQPKMLAVELGGSGDVTADRVRYTYAWQVPANPSPLLIGRRIFMVNNQGNATWLNAFTGESIWRQRLRGQHYASPLEAEGRIYSWRIDGSGVVIAADDSYELLAENELDGEIRATPAIADGSFFIRTDGHLYRTVTAVRPADD
ncbi:MAG: PQQ-binding-like beta-propeller repeat protein [Acidobacteriota bacterium]